MMSHGEKNLHFLKMWGLKEQLDRVIASFTDS